MVSCLRSVKSVALQTYLEAFLSFQTGLAKVSFFVTSFFSSSLSQNELVSREFSLILVLIPWNGVF